MAGKGTRPVALRTLPALALDGSVMAIARRTQRSIEACAGKALATASAAVLVLASLSFKADSVVAAAATGNLKLRVEESSTSISVVKEHLHSTWSGSRPMAQY